MRTKWICLALLLFNGVMLLSPYMRIEEPFKEGVEIVNIHSSADYPAFVPPSKNESTLENGSIQLSGTDIHWRLFAPNSSVLYQDPNFWMSFDIKWENLEEDHHLSIELAEIGDYSSYHLHIGTLATIEEVVLDSENNFIRYSEWWNGTYYFMNKTRTMFVDSPLFDSEALNLTVSVCNDFNYTRLFSHTILTDNKAPVPQIVHPRYNITSNELQLDWNNTKYQVNITDSNEIVYGGLTVLYTNISTSQEEQLVLWESYNIENGKITEIEIQQDLLEQYMVAAGSILQDPLQVDIEFLLIDEFSNSHLYELSLCIDRPNATTSSNTQTVVPIPPLIIPIVVTCSIVGAVVIIAINHKHHK